MYMTTTYDDVPETQRQAQRWDAVKAHYLRKGLCAVCAAQAAYGHQLGFGRVKPPCDACVPLVTRFPGKGAGDWRTDALDAQPR